MTAIGAIAPDSITQIFPGNKIKALAFDAFPIFDPRPILALAEELFPGKGQELSNLWRIRQFEYQWLRTLSDKYQDFWTVTQDALIFAAKSVKVNLTEEKRMKLMDAYLNLKTWPDVLPALQSLKDTGIKLVFLSNMTEKMLRQNIKVNGLADMFYDVFSTDINHSYKPSPKAYQIAIDRLKLKKSEIGFVAFAGWDASGAKSFGYPTYWINRQDQPNEELGVSPDWTGNSLNDLVNYLAK
ncbi:MAG: haloacid dehalogenase type II [Bacteroidota bacterium]|nr:haloacid dehalogenase type II [Bacteroidota bacterium]